MSAFGVSTSGFRGTEAKRGGLGYKKNKKTHRAPFTRRRRIFSVASSSPLCGSKSHTNASKPDLAPQ